MWKADPRSRREFGPYSLTSLRAKHGTEGAHLVEGPSWALRVVPDGHTSGAKRAKVLSEILTALPQFSAISGEVHALTVGRLTLEGLKWEPVLTETTIEEWLDEWFELFGLNKNDVKYARESLLGDLADDGWQIGREGVS